MIFLLNRLFLLLDGQFDCVNLVRFSLVLFGDILLVMYYCGACAVTLLVGLTDGIHRVKSPAPTIVAWRLSEHLHVFLLHLHTFLLSCSA